MKFHRVSLRDYKAIRSFVIEPRETGVTIIEGENDHTVPWAIADAAYNRQKRNPGVTEIVKMPNRGHSLTIDHGWREVAETALNFVKRFV